MIAIAGLISLPAPLLAQYAPAETCREVSSNFAPTLVERILIACDRAIGASPGNATFDLFSARGSAFLELEQFDKAVADLTQAIKLHPNNVSTYSRRAEAYVKLKDFAKALADTNRYVDANPDFYLAYSKRAQILHAMGDKAAEFADLKKAASLVKPDAPGAQWTLSDLRRRMLDIDVPAFAGLQPTQPPSNSDARAPVAAVSPPPAPAAPVSPPPAAAPPVVAAIAPAATPPAPAVVKPPFNPGRRVALVIGNSAYTAFPKIPNPRNDAEDLAASLRKLSFDVVLGVDLNRADMEDRLIAFARRARQSDTALVFYAGHGIQHQGINYLAPIDAKLADESDLRRLVNLQDIVNDLQSAGKVRILIVDACRDNEAVQQLANNLPKSRAAAFTRGLARVDADGTFVAFATQPNRVAADGAGRNSPFTQSLLKRLNEPGVELRTMMTRVRADVVESTSNGQRPEVWDSLVGEFAFSAQ